MKYFLHAYIVTQQSGVSFLHPDRITQPSRNVKVSKFVRWVDKELAQKSNAPFYRNIHLKMFENNGLMEVALIVYFIINLPV